MPSRDACRADRRARSTGGRYGEVIERRLGYVDDIDTVIVVYAADLAHNCHTHLLIARELDAAGRPAEALEWAERGIREAGDLTNRRHRPCRPPRRPVRTDRTTRRRRRPASRPLRGTPQGGYQQLRAAALAADRWPAEREGALALLRALAEREESDRDPVLVGALPDNQDIDRAGQAATKFGASDGQWLTLAEQSRSTRPAEALAVYLRLAAPFVGRTRNHAYEQLVSLLLSIRDCHRRLGTPDDFAAYATELRAAHKRKRNLMRLMDEHEL